MIPQNDTALRPEEQIKAYFAAAWKPIRLHGETKKCVDREWQKRWVSEEEILAWHAAGGGVGIQVGPHSGHIVAVDLDTVEARTLAPKFLPDTLKAGKELEDLPSHWVYRSEGASYFQVKDGPREVISFKASGPENGYAGHQFAAAPSVHAEKGAYVWRPGFDPAAVLDIGRERLVDAVRRLAIAALVLKHLPAEGDGRHEYSKAIAGTLLRKGYDAAALAEILTTVWETAGGSREGRKMAAKNVRDTAEKLAEEKPFTARTRLNEMVPGLADSITHATGLRYRVDIGREEGESGRSASLDDYELATRWLYKHKDMSHSAHGWMSYQDGYWSKVEDGLVSQGITRFLGKTPGTKTTANRVGSVSKLAADESYVKTDLWDARRDIIVCKNGTLDLESFEVRDHRPEDYAMGALPFEYDPGAGAETWNEYLGGHVGVEKWAFLQEFAGYCLTTDTSHETAVWLVGPGGSGKSTYIEGLSAIMGTRAGQLSLADIERSSFALENIVGKTLLTATEQPSMFIKQVDILNALISGEMLKINRKNKAIVDVRSVAKIAWAMNTRPRIREEGNGIFRRLQLVEFPALDVEHRDPAVKRRIMELEAPGILAWAVEGLKRLRKRGGFEVPEAIKAAVRDFEYTNDPPRQFLDECTKRGAEYNTGKRALYKAYAAWCKTYGYKPKAEAMIREDWLRLGLLDGKTHGTKVYRGAEVTVTPSMYGGLYDED
jgi:P4 family phage/plasmid primase-like protien